ncbi:hypothetical protein HDV03_003820 [Kappamyces sp. JEL0829]|nr:hypothetical protein HDV03_003820 [Kappamyces sp. JEL0829]
MSPNPAVFAQPFYMSDLYFIMGGTGLGFGLCNLVALLSQYGFRFTTTTSKLQILNAVFGLANAVVALFVLLLPQSSCVSVISTVVLYLLAEFCMDAVLLIRLLALYGAGHQMLKSVWILGFVLFDMAPRAVHVLLNSYNFIDKVSLCQLIPNQLSAHIQDGAVMMYVLLMGLRFGFSLYQATRNTDSILKLVGIKSTVFTLLLIVVKFSLYIPFSVQLMGPYSTAFVLLQVPLEGILLTLTTQWTKSHSTLLGSSRKATSTNQKSSVNVFTEPQSLSR